MKLIRHGRKALLAGVALAACMGFAVNAQAQTCTVGNWDGGATGLSDADTGTQGADNRRYGGPCGLRVPVDGTARYVSDNSPGNEPVYIARFYAFLDDAGDDPVQIFAADDGAADQIQVWYNETNPGDLTLRVFDAGATANDLTFAGVSSGWHSIEFVWSADAAAAIAFSVDGAADITETVDTSGIAIANAHLGNVSGADTGGSIDFDDFDSRRMERPGRLCRGDTNDDGQVTQVDMLTIFAEVASGGTSFADGQPDYNEDGSISQIDFLQVLNSHVSVGNPACP